MHRSAYKTADHPHPDPRKLIPFPPWITLVITWFTLRAFYIKIQREGAKTLNYSVRYTGESRRWNALLTSVGGGGFLRTPVYWSCPSVGQLLLRITDGVESWNNRNIARGRGAVYELYNRPLLELNCRNLCGTTGGTFLMAFVLITFNKFYCCLLNNNTKRLIPTYVSCRLISKSVITF